MQIRISRQSEPVFTTASLAPLAGIPMRWPFPQPAEVPVTPYLRSTGKDCASHRGLIELAQILLLCRWHHQSPMGHTVTTTLSWDDLLACLDVCQVHLPPRLYRA